ncbi:MAG: RHS repeat-associated core domain-containing protein [Bacteroidales bacterium]|jgi:RHS repeat-associated protein|nr:RHS repeat-associated core domain-containing protein [Bacteroidales bacterium]
MELLSYFYHPDHLGSSSWITDGSGQAIQHLHYLPFGEDWVDQRNSSWNAPYTFSGKEKDVETGYGYFGARYYDSGLSIWLSVDPMSDKYPNMSPYNYCANNPVKLIDPNGEGPIDRVAAARLFLGDKYKQEMFTSLRTGFSDKAMEYQDCSELVCRVLAFDKITDGVMHRNTSGLKKFLDNTDKFEHTDNSPQVGDIALWKGHTGIVTDVDKNGNIKIAHAKSTKDGVVEESEFKSSSQISSKEFYLYYRPKNETPDGKVDNIQGGSLNPIEVKSTPPSNLDSNSKKLIDE